MFRLIYLTDQSFALFKFYFTVHSWKLSECMESDVKKKSRSVKIGNKANKSMGNIAFHTFI